MWFNVSRLKVSESLFSSRLNFDATNGNSARWEMPKVLARTQPCMLEARVQSLASCASPLYCQGCSGPLAVPVQGHELSGLCPAQSLLGSSQSEDTCCLCFNRHGEISMWTHLISVTSSSWLSCVLSPDGFWGASLYI